MNNIALGSYLPLNSIIHRLDPRAKICAMLLMMIAIFLPAGYLRLCSARHLHYLCKYVSQAKIEFFMAGNEADAFYAYLLIDYQFACRA